jgi:WD40 repeat protein
MKIVFLLFISLVVFGANIHQPDVQYKASGTVNDMVLSNMKLYCGTTNSSVDIFDLQTKKRTETLKLPKIKNFLNEDIESKVYSVDVLGNEILVLSQATGGFREVRMFKDKKATLIIGKEKKLYVAKAKFIDKNTLLLALLSNDIISYNIQTKKENWIMQASLSKFSNLVMSEDRSEVVVADESGDLHLINTKDGHIIKVFTGQNLDNVFSVDYKKGTIIAGGQDRRVAIYDTAFNSAYHIETPFFVYGVGLSPKGKLAAYSSDENNNVTLYKLSTKSKLGVYGNNKMTLTKIIFLNEKEFVVSSDDNSVNYYKIK